MGHKSTKMEHGLSQADLNFLVKNTNRSKKEIKVGLKLKLFKEGCLLSFLQYDMSIPIFSSMELLNIMFQFISIF